MKRHLSTFLTLAAVAMASVVAGFAMDRGGPHDRPVIFVKSQGLYYDSIVVADPVPRFGPFQLLEMGKGGLETEFGPGDRGYYGGRWKEDFDGDGEFHYFVCPLLPPGRRQP